MQDFHRQKGAGRRKFYQGKKHVGYGKVTFLQGMAGVYQADDLTGGDQEISD